MGLVAGMERHSHLSGEGLGVKLGERAVLTAGGWRPVGPDVRLKAPALVRPRQTRVPRARSCRELGHPRATSPSHHDDGRWERKKTEWHTQDWARPSAGGRAATPGRLWGPPA